MSCIFICTKCSEILTNIHARTHLKKMKNIPIHDFNDFEYKKMENCLIVKNHPLTNGVLNVSIHE